MNLNSLPKAVDSEDKFFGTELNTVNRAGLFNVFGLVTFLGSY